MWGSIWEVAAVSYREIGGLRSCAPAAEAAAAASAGDKSIEKDAKEACSGDGLRGGVCVGAYGGVYSMCVEYVRMCVCACVRECVCA